MKSSITEWGQFLKGMSSQHRVLQMSELLGPTVTFTKAIVTGAAVLTDGLPEVGNVGLKLSPSLSLL